ncbi:uncharacterized protein LOC144169660 [Haemaphysalis longicornis]
MEHRQTSQLGWKSPPAGTKFGARAARRLLVPLPPGDYLAVVDALPSWRPALAPQASVQQSGLEAHRARRRLLHPLGSAAPWALRRRSSRHAVTQRITDMTYPTYSMQPRPATSPVRSTSPRAFRSGSWLGSLATGFSQ